MKDLKLIALDAEDLAVLSAHLQDAVLQVGDMAYLAGEHRFALVANRFDWDSALRGKEGREPFQRRRTGLRLERVLGAKVSGIDLADSSAPLAVLALTFEPGNSPGGVITLRFSGGGAVRLDVECIEAELKDLGAAWVTRRKPEHVDDDEV